MDMEVQEMKLPGRYKEVLDFFEGLHIAGEMLGENVVKFQIQKTKSSMQVLTKTSLGNVQSYADKRLYFFKEENFEKQSKFYFAFTVTLEREKDEILIHAFLPRIGENYYFATSSALKKMYENGFVFDLLKSGFQEARINEVSSQGIELFAIAGPTISYEQISELYSEVKSLNTRAFSAAGMK
jgi:hypothetical protein